MIDLIWLGIIAVVSISLGITILKWFRIEPEDRASQAAFGGALGLGVLGYGVFALTALHWVSSVSAMVLLALSAIISAPTMFSIGRELVGRVRAFRPSRLIVAGIFIFALHAAVHLVSAFNPPIDLDVLGYHLPLPKLQIALNQLVIRPDIVYSNWPLHQEMLFQLGMLLSSDALAQLISFLVATLAAFAIWACARKRVGSDVALVAAFVFYSIPVVGYEASIAYVDVGVALFSVLAFFALVEWRASTDYRWLVLAAIMAGFAPAVKLSGAFIPALFALGILFFTPRGRNRMASVLIFSSLAGAVVSPWLIRTWLATGNPITPYAFDWLGAREWTASAAHQSTAMFAPFGLGRDMLALIALPWNLTMSSTAFGGGNIGPIFLATLPLLLLARPFPSIVRAALLLIAAYLAVWFAVVQEVRFLIPIMPMLSLIVAYALMHWATTSRLARGVVIALIAFTSIANLILLASNFARPPGSVPATKSLAVIFGRESRIDYLRRIIPSQRMIEAINALAPSSRVLLLGFSDVYYIDREFIRGFPIEQPFFDAYALASADAMAERVRTLHITHVVMNYHVDNGRYDFIGPGAPAAYISALEEFASRDLTLMNEVNNYRLYVWR